MKEPRKIYSKFIDRETEVEKVEVSKNEKGEEVKTTIKAKEKVPVELVVIQPTRKMREDAEIYYASTLSDLISKNVLTRHMLRKKIIDGAGGFLTKEENKEFADVIKRLQEIEMEYQRIIFIDEKDRTKEDKEKLDILQVEYAKIQRQLNELEQTQQSLFSNTAEVIARNKLSAWWMLYLSYMKEKGALEPKPIFAGNSLEEKYESYDELEDKNDPFYNEMMTVASLVVTLWHNGTATTQQEIDEVMKELTEPEVEEGQAEEAKVEEVQPAT